MRPIDADNIISVCEILSEKCDNQHYWNQLISIIEDMPTIDAMPVEWLREKMQKPQITCANPFGFVLAEWLEEHPEPVYPTWTEWLYEMGLILKPSGADQTTYFLMNNGIKLNNVLSPKADTPIPADIAQKLEIDPKEGA